MSTTMCEHKDGNRYPSFSSSYLFSNIGELVVFLEKIRGWRPPRVRSAPSVLQEQISVDDRRRH